MCTNITQKMFKKKFETSLNAHSYKYHAHNLFGSACHKACIQRAGTKRRIVINWPLLP